MGGQQGGFGGQGQGMPGQGMGGQGGVMQQGGGMQGGGMGARGPQVSHWGLLILFALSVQLPTIRAGSVAVMALADCCLACVVTVAILFVLHLGHKWVRQLFASCWLDYSDTKVVDVRNIFFR